ncbi:MAG: hypothetical protein JJU36_12570 [Phycisphaeraceae bacterium]|nr:hypothetical protein [Phycisphaeraceae bacterium]
MTAPLPLRLWHDHHDLKRLQRLLTEEHPHINGLLEVARKAATPKLDEALVPEPDRHGHYKVKENFAIGCAVVHLLTGDASFAHKALAAGLHIFKVINRSDLGLSDNLHHLAVIQQCCAEAWSEAERRSVVDALERGVGQLHRIGEGNPHNVGNNWWSVTHGGALIGALAIHGRAGSDGVVRDMGRTIDWAAGRLEAFCKHYGDAGIYHEGLGYQRYASGSLLAALIGLRRATGRDILAQHPNLRLMPVSLAAASCLCEVEGDSNSERGFGAMLSWNDSGEGLGGGMVDSIGLAIAPEQYRGALRTLFDRFHGHRSPEPDYAPGFAGLYHALIHYPYDHEPAEPEGLLPRSLCDSRQGLWVARDRYGDGDEAVLGAYARSTHVGGHSQDDAGSVRLMALGRQWVRGGGQARPDAAFQTVMYPTPPEPPTRRSQRGLVIWDQRGRRTAQFAMDLRAASNCYHERYLACRWADQEAPLILAMLDVVDEHREGVIWHWNHTFGTSMRCDLRQDRQGYTLTAEDGSTMVVHLFGHTPDRLAVESMPESRRTFSGGHEVTYLGRPFVSARFDPRKLVHMLMVATVQPAGMPAPTIRLRETGLAITAGAVTWNDPFGAAVPPTFRLGASRNLCLRPDGAAT